MNNSYFPSKNESSDGESATLEFTLSSLRAFLSHIRGIAPVYRFCDQPQENAGGFLLRHDIDLDLWPAVRLAELEKSVGVRSTFFVMMTNEFYNPAAIPERRLLSQLVTDGFEVGLHFDPTVYGECKPSELQSAAENEAHCLSKITGVPVGSLSLHNPTNSGIFTLFDGFHNAYDPVYFSPEKYISDSYMQISFVRNEPYKFVERGLERLVQILLHPCQFNEQEINFAEILEKNDLRVRLRKAEAFETMLKVTSK